MPNQSKLLRVPLCIAIFAWRATWNYAYSPFNRNKSIYTTTQNNEHKQEGH